MFIGDLYIIGFVGFGYFIFGWWDGVVGLGVLIDIICWCVVVINVFGGCCGFIGFSLFVCDGKFWGLRFLLILICD